MSITIFRRKIYDKMLEWKTNRSQKYSLLIKGARRVGKSTIAKEFAKKITDKVKHLTDIPTPVKVPGDPAAPYYVPEDADGQPAKFLKAKPKTDLSKCCNCGACARVCPMGAIDPTDVSSVPGTCIKCQACVRKCTHRAKYFDDEAFLSHVKMLEQNFQDPKENEVFL